MLSCVCKSPIILLIGLLPCLGYGQDSTQTNNSSKFGLDNLGVTVLDYRTTFFGQREAVIWGTSLGYVYGEKRSKIALGLYTAVYNKTGSLSSVQWRANTAGNSLPRFLPGNAA